MASVGEVGEGAPLTDGKTETIARIIRGRIGRPIRNLLVVGCGSGVEAAILARELGADVIGIDLNSTFDPRASVKVRLLHGLSFPMNHSTLSSRITHSSIFRITGVL
jgi:protein-L-isoaspartate O-methyltransferase